MMIRIIYRLTERFLNDRILTESHLDPEDKKFILIQFHCEIVNIYGNDIADGCDICGANLKRFWC